MYILPFIINKQTDTICAWYAINNTVHVTTSNSDTTAQINFHVGATMKH